MFTPIISDIPRNLSFLIGAVSVDTSLGIDTASDNAATMIIVLIALGILGWGYYRALPFGKLGILAWLQSVSLMSPWLLFFGLFGMGIYLSLAGILLLLVGSTLLYIYLGKKLRAAGEEELLRSRAEKMLSSVEAPPDGSSLEPAKARVQPATMEKPELVPIPAEDLKAIQGIFGIDTFFATETIPFQDGVICKGNLRGDPELIYSRMSEKLHEKLSDRYRLFLVENTDGRPVVIILPSKNDPQPTTISQKVLAVVLMVMTIATSLETGGLLLGFDFFSTPLRYSEALPIAGGILTVLIAHEIGHQVFAKRHNVKFSWPFFIPTWQIGSFGAVNRFESVLPSRKVLFDVAIAGPAAGGIVSLVMLIAGFLLSHQDSLFKVPAAFFKESILVGTLARVVLGDTLHQPVIGLHPLVVIGWFGLVITALNLMPAGQLDGGRIVQAIYGRKIAGRATFATFIVLAIVSFLNPLALYWAVVILILQRNLERPSLNELTEPDDARAALGLLALFLMIAVLLPLTPALAGRLGIGS
jgi:membrane-associated protease RseP (regulator of RpoE activity)